jgi:hypothetical protein
LNPIIIRPTINIRTIGAIKDTKKYCFQGKGPFSGPMEPIKWAINMTNSIPAVKRKRVSKYSLISVFSRIEAIPILLLTPRSFMNSSLLKK